MKNWLFRLSAFFILLCLGAPLLAVSAAEIPYESYTYWSDVSEENKAVYNRPMYETETVIDSQKLGIDAFAKINSIDSDDSGNIYILDNSSRITVLDSEYKVIREIRTVSGQSYDEANSLYVHKDGTVYICDTQNHRILHITSDGELMEQIMLPDSPLLPDDFDFLPTKVTVDSKGYTYVLSDGSYYGALLYSPEKIFLGFYGANTVKASLSSVITNMKERIFPNNEKKGNTAQQLPYCFVDIECDAEGFIYTCNGYTEKYGRTGQIRKLSPGTGKNILNSEDVNFVDTKINSSYSDGAMSRQDIMAIAVDEQGFIYGLDSAFGRVFLYDADCRILTAFGGGMGQGTQKGTFVTVSGLTITENGNKVLVCDSVTNRITVFKITDFGRKAKNAVALTLDGDYDEIKEKWYEVLALDNNFQPAYSGLARVYLNNRAYADAMDYAKKGYDRETYALAFEYYRRDFVNDNFILFFSVITAVAVGVIALLAVSMRKKLVLIKNAELSRMFAVTFHPSNTFADIKEKGFGSVGLCFITLLLYYVATVLQTVKGGFLFYIYDAESFNSLWVFVRSVGLVVLWIAADWMVCTLLGGKGKIREIIIVTCYSLWPLIFEKLLRLILTNILLPEEASFLSILDTLALIWFWLLMITGLLKIHDFGMTRLIGTSLLAAACIAAIIFLIIMITMLIQQFYGFIITVISEILTL